MKPRRYNTRARVELLERVANAAIHASRYNNWERRPIRSMSATTINNLLEELERLQLFDTEQGLKKCLNKK